MQDADIRILSSTTLSQQAEARVVLESIIMHQLEPDALSQTVALHLLNTPHPNGAPADFDRRVALGVRYLGTPLATALGFPMVGRFAHFRAGLEFWGLRAYSYAGSLPLIGGAVLRMNRWAVGFFLKKITLHNPHWALKHEFGATYPPAPVANANKCPVSTSLSGCSR